VSGTFNVLADDALAFGVCELLSRQTHCRYHFHHGNDEMVVVLSGEPTLRTPEGETPDGAA
jgi:hypothetical protein